MCPRHTANTSHEFFKEHDKVPRGTPDFPDLNTTELSGRDCREATQPAHVLTSHVQRDPLMSGTLRPDWPELNGFNAVAILAFKTCKQF